MTHWLAIQLILATSLALSAHAQEWPSRTIRAVVPVTAGSATDVAARSVMNAVSSELKTSIIVDNRPGAGNTIGMSLVARAEPDGYTVLINSSSHTVVPATFSKLGFSALEDLKPVAVLGNVPVVVVVSAESKYRTLGDLVTAAKARPGALTFATAGAGNFSHLATEAFRRAAGFDAIHVPMRGAPEAVIEVLAGRVDFFFSPLTVALSLIEDGKLQPLAVSGSLRALALPDVPTTAEAGYPGSEYNFWVAMFVPSKTPDQIAKALTDNVEKTLQSHDLKRRLSTIGVDPMPISIADFAALMVKEVLLNTEIAKAAGLQVN